MHVQYRGLEAVGFVGLGTGFNFWMYLVRRRVLRRALARAHLSLKGKTVLEVGAGTGFYVRRWLELGAAHVSGIDLSATAVEALRGQFPMAEFVCGDIAEPPTDLSDSGPYDLVSAFDVLYHIVDEVRYAHAITNLGRLTRQHGHLLLSDNFLHGPPIRGREQVSRSLTEIEDAVAAAGFETVVRLPMFVLMNNPVDSDSRFLHRSWQAIQRVCYRSHVAGAVLGAVLFPLELLLTAVVREGPSTELVVFRRR
jgi:SAM-dependent methyltransferase